MGSAINRRFLGSIILMIPATSPKLTSDRTLPVVTLNETSAPVITDDTNATSPVDAISGVLDGSSTTSEGKEIMRGSDSCFRSPATCAIAELINSIEIMEARTDGFSFTGSTLSIRDYAIGGGGFLR